MVFLSNNANIAINNFKIIVSLYIFIFNSIILYYLQIQF